MAGFDAARRRMVEEQVAARGIRDPRVLQAMRGVPRERFLPGREALAFLDGPQPIAGGQTISQPYVVALMAEAARIGAADRVLEIGTGSGYAAAVLAELAARVVTVERLATLADEARQRLADLGCTRIEVRLGDGTLGAPDLAPFDAIIVSAGGPSVPKTLCDQLAIGGRLVIPVGPDVGRQRLLRITRREDGALAEEDLGAVHFVPLIGEGGWADTFRSA
ncbi:protein-L-isoaspartate(D-aspartate) O-methyltransferase [Rhodobacter sp. CZR27]|uniref:protein-L-isoaspartate(D-aspartate) O-methyltransferase n=1 Tax=Rhodobacter sp. CZR27 TaxID=2033869 RepID=UPI000BBF0046|nr:protein-L-isoaspartate(D-aspartate) O-methyltransferase [Rhodobacter sp. CZR27]